MRIFSSTLNIIFLLVVTGCGGGGGGGGGTPQPPTTPTQPSSQEFSVIVTAVDVRRVDDGSLVEVDGLPMEGSTITVN